MIYTQQAHLPIVFQVDEGIIGRVDEFLKRNKLYFEQVLVVSGGGFSRRYAEPLVQQNHWSHYVLPTNTFGEVENLRREIVEHKYDLVVGVGGGKVMDSVKRACYLTNVNHFAVPTIISNDGLISPIAVIKNEEGKTESLPGLMPMGVLIDIDIIQHSPELYIRGAAGDILSNISATNDWVLALNEGREQMNDIAYHLARSAAYSLVHYDHAELKSKAFLRLVVQGQIHSGIAMALAGTSRPCSGSEHLISHAMDFLGFATQIHGIQVASISLFTLFLQQKLRPEHLKYAEKVGVPLRFWDTFKEVSEANLEKVLEIAPEMRPGRYTILSRFKTPEVLDSLIKYKEYLSVQGF